MTGKMLLNFLCEPVVSEYLEAHTRQRWSASRKKTILNNISIAYFLSKTKRTHVIFFCTHAKDEADLGRRTWPPEGDEKILSRITQSIHIIVQQCRNLLNKLTYPFVILDARDHNQFSISVFCSLSLWYVFVVVVNR